LLPKVESHFTRKQVLLFYTKNSSRPLAAQFFFKVEQKMGPMIDRKFLYVCFWQLALILCALTPTNLQAASYNTETGELFLPSLVNDSKTWTNVTIKLNSDGTYIVQNGIKSLFPFLCPGTFSQTTFDLIKSQSTISSPEEINSLLGCRWLRKTKTVTDGNEFIPEMSSSSYIWLDSNCSSLGVGFGSSIAGIFGLSIDKKKGSCASDFSQPHAPYDLNSKLFLVNSVKVNNNIAAAEVLIKFSDGNKYELISFSLSSLEPSPLICDSLKEVDFDAVSTEMSPEEISNLLGCQWNQKISSSEFAVTTYSWMDHECNSIDITATPNSKSKTFLHLASGGCGSFSAR